MLAGERVVVFGDAEDALQMSAEREDRRLGAGQPDRERCKASRSTHQDQTSICRSDNGIIAAHQDLPVVVAERIRNMAEALKGLVIADGQRLI